MQFGRYKLVRKIASGGMGEIFQARTLGVEGFEKPMALKRIFPHLGQDETYRRRFIREAKVTARLIHPNIVQVYDLGEQDEQLFIAMEYVQGPDLSRIVKHLRDGDRVLAPEIVATIGFDLLEALDFAHTLTDENGEPLLVVHRDVSPHNVLIDGKTAVVKLCDFGVARAVGNSNDTLDGRMVGKLRYMSPEQGMAGPIDARADIFALGLVLFEAATGDPAYGETNQLELLRAVRSGEVPDARQRKPDVPEALAAALHRALRPRAEDRFQTAAAFRDAIEDYLVVCDPRQARRGLRELAGEFEATTITPLPVKTQVTSADEPTSRWQKLLNRRDSTELRALDSTEPDRELPATIIVPAGADPSQFETTVARAALDETVAVTPPRGRDPFTRWLVLSAALAFAFAIGSLLVWQSTRPAGDAEEAAATAGAGGAAGAEVEDDDWTEESESDRSTAVDERSGRPKSAGGRGSARRRTTRNARSGYLTIETGPWAAVTIDGELIEKPGPLRRHPLPIGRHEVQVQEPDSTPRTFTVFIQGGRTISRNLAPAD